MASRISEEHKHRLMKINGSRVRIEKNHSRSFVIYGLNNGTEPRTDSLESAISLAESLISTRKKK